MNNRLFVAVVALLTSTFALGADEIRYFEQNGITYRETRRTIDRPSPQTGYQDCPRTVYREQLSTETREVIRTWWTPVTEYRWETYWVNRWNPFAEPYQAARYVPHTRWERRTEVVQVPVVCRRLVPETQTVQVPATTWRSSPQEVTTRVAVSGLPGAGLTPGGSVLSSAPLAAHAAPAAASLRPSGGMVPVEGRRDGIGGISRFGDEPPRYGQRPAWEASGRPH